MQDIGTGSKTAMQQIAAEELGLPLDRVEISAGDTARGPYASISAGSSTIPSMGPAVRAAAADAARQVIEIAAQRHDKEERTLSLKDGHVVCSDGGSWPLEEVVGVLEDGQILGKGARGPNPTGMQVLTFGVQVAEVAVDVETGEVRVERIAAIHDVGRVINPLGASSQVEGGIIQGIGHTLSEERLLDPETGTDAHGQPRRVQAADDRRRPGDRHRPARRRRPASDEPRREGSRRAADRPDGRRDRERDPRRDRRRRPLAADHARGDAARARGSAEARTRAREASPLDSRRLSRERRRLRPREVEAALARHGVGADSIVTTADGGDAGVSLDDDGAVFIVRSLTRELAQVIFEVARRRRPGDPAGGRDADGVRRERRRDGARRPRRRRRPRCGRAVRRAPPERGAAWSSHGLSRSQTPSRRSATAPSRSRAAPSSCRCSTRASSARTRSSSCGRRCRRGSTARRSAPARRSASSRSTRRSRRRCARRAASPRRRSCARPGTIGGNLLQATRCWYWRLQVPVPPARRRPLPRARGRAPRARDLRERLLRVGASVRSRGRAARARRDGPHRPARAADRGPLPAADRRRPCDDDAREGRADSRARGSEARRVRLPEGDGPAALVVRARRRRAPRASGTTCASASRAWRRSRGAEPRRCDAAAAAPPTRRRSSTRSSAARAQLQA